MVEAADKIRQTNRVDVEHRRSVRIVAEFGGIASDGEDVLQPKRPRSQQSDCKPMTLRSRHARCRTVSIPTSR